LITRPRSKRFTLAFKPEIERIFQPENGMAKNVKKLTMKKDLKL
jgi:hypothetical protein